LEEKDGVISAIRLIDKITVVDFPDVPEGQVAAIHTKALVALKSGDVRGPRSIKLILKSPSGKRVELTQTQGLFEGNEHGIQITIDLRFALAGEGLYWCDVLVEDKVLTRMPLRIVYPKTAPGASAKELPPREPGTPSS
jgi:hypothetical protein